jgi:hypothetical protein
VFSAHLTSWNIHLEAADLAGSGRRKARISKPAPRMTKLVDGGEAALDVDVARAN